MGKRKDPCLRNKGRVGDFGGSMARFGETGLYHSRGREGTGTLAKPQETNPKGFSGLFVLKASGARCYSLFFQEAAGRTPGVEVVFQQKMDQVNHADGRPPKESLDHDLGVILLDEAVGV